MVVEAAVAVEERHRPMSMMAVGLRERTAAEAVAEAAVEGRHRPTREQTAAAAVEAVAAVEERRSPMGTLAVEPEQ